MSNSSQHTKDEVTKLQEELRASELEVSLAENIVATYVLYGSKGTSSSTRILRHYHKVRYIWRDIQVLFQLGIHR